MSRLRYFDVKGSGNFPFELLSRFECFPANTLEAEKLRLACPTIADERTITLASAQRDPPSTRLWKDLKWPIVAME